MPLFVIILVCVPSLLNALFLRSIRAWSWSSFLYSEGIIAILILIYPVIYALIHETRMDELAAKIDDLSDRVGMDPGEPYDDVIEGGLFEVVLRDTGLDKNGVIRGIREISGATAREARRMVDSAPQTILAEANWEMAAALQLRLVKLGARVEIQQVR